MFDRDFPCLGLLLLGLTLLVRNASLQEVINVNETVLSVAPQDNFTIDEPDVKNLSSEVHQEGVETRQEVENIFRVPNPFLFSNDTVIETLNETVTVETFLNETFLTSEVSFENSSTWGNTSFFRGLESSDESEGRPIGATESAAILAGVVVVMGVGGYIGFILWRRFLQIRYGNSEMLITDDFYDVTDLRNFEI